MDVFLPAVLPVTPLLKIPLLISCTYLTVQALTPPRPPPSSMDRTAYSKDADPLGTRFFSRQLPYIIRTIHWLDVVCEATAILASQFPDARFTGKALFLLTGGVVDKAMNIRLTPVWLAGCLLMHCGSLLRLNCYRALGKFFTWELSVKHDQTLVTWGPYGVVRHPSYTGAVIMSVGAAFCHLGHGSWFAECIGMSTFGTNFFAVLWATWLSLILPYMLFSRVDREDGALRKHFGEQWEDYAKLTPYKMVPFIY